MPIMSSAATSFGIDAQAVTDWIARLGVEFDGDLEFRRIGLGQSNITVLVSDGSGRRWILRRPPLGELLASAHDVVREHRILRALNGTDVPVPDILGLCEDPEVSEAPLLLMEHVDGLVVDRIDLAEALDHEVRRGIGDSMATTLARMHAVDLDRAGLSTLASHKPYAQRQLKRWSGQWEKAKTRELPQLDRLTKLLWDSIPEQAETVLVHGDFHIRNVICAPESGSLRAVLDWELCTLGDPLADMGSLLAYWPQTGDLPSPLFAASTLPGFATREELADAYLAATGRDEAALGFWHVLGIWKIAIICEGVMRRSMDQPLNAAEGGPPDAKFVDQLVEHARATATGLQL
jgi:aminoglycoside phosphotransferase (APT) family kinase protein